MFTQAFFLSSFHSFESETMRLVDLLKTSKWIDRKVDDSTALVVKNAQTQLFAALSIPQLPNTKSIGDYNKIISREVADYANKYGKTRLSEINYNKNM